MTRDYILSPEEYVTLKKQIDGGNQYEVLMEKRKREAREMLMNKKWERQEKTLNTPRSIERKINDLIQDMFRELMYTNTCAESSTLKICLDEVKTGYVMVRMSCKVREATGRTYYPEVIYKNGGNTTVKWKDGTHTTVKRAEGTTDDDYNAFTAALAIKAIGTNSAVKREIAKKLVIQKKNEKKAKTNDG